MPLKDPLTAAARDVANTALPLGSPLDIKKYILDSQMNQKEQPPTINLTDLVPRGWFSNPEESSIWVTGYRIVGGDEKELKQGKVFDFDKVRIVILFGSISYLDSSRSRWEWSDPNKVKFNLKVENVKAPEGCYLLLITPFIVDGVQENESEVKKRITVSSGLVAALAGRNSIYERLYDNLINIQTGHISGFSPIFENPSVFPRPDFSEPRSVLLSKAIKAAANLDNTEKNRFELALHWYESAFRSTGVDSFLKSWIAVEVLMMPDSTNIKSINESLSRAYSLSVDEVKDRFYVGQLFGLRSRIVHKGEVIPVHYLLEWYLQAIFEDVLFERLGLPSIHRAASVQKRPDFNLQKFLK